MSNTDMKTQLQRQRRTLRTREKLHGTASRPRLNVSVSNTNVRAQLIDDDSGKAIAASTSVNSKKTSMTDKAIEVGKDIADKAKKAKITEAIFDRGFKKYHGRVKALADAAREAGLKV
jgi:large subunit ribosomal protein L18